MKLPFVKQETTKDCGISCLLMIIRYYHGNIPRERLRELTRTGRDGVTAYDLIEAAKKLNFSAIGVKGDTLELSKRDLPCIAHVVVDGKYSHYVVVYKVNSKKILIADPASSLKMVTVEEFRRISTKVFLIFSPRKKIPKIEVTRELKSFVFTILTVQKKRIILFLLFSFGLFFLQLVSSFQLKYLMEYVVSLHSKYNLLSYVILFMGLSFIKGCFQVCRFHLIQDLIYQFGKCMYMKVYQHLLSLPYLYYRNHSTGEIVTRLLELEKLESIFPTSIFLFFVELPFSFLILCILGILRKEILFLIFLFFGISGFILFFLQIIGNVKLKEAKRKAEKMNSYLMESLLGIDAIQSLNYQQRFQTTFSLLYNRYKKGQCAFLRNCNTQQVLSKGIEELFLVSLLVFCSICILDGNMTIGNLIFYHSLCIYLLDPFHHFLNFQLEYKEAREAWKNIGELLSIPSENLLGKKKMLKLSLETIVLEKVSYSYNARARVLNDLSLRIERGDKILIYGESGGGKSTLAKLLSRILEPEKGSILFNGNDIKNYPLSFIREKILYVPQKGYLFSTTVLENISYSRDEEILEKTLEVGKLCMVDEVVKGKLEGYHWIIEENGYNLSGGERQRIILARSLFKNASIYIFDESFSELDPIRERTILEKIFSKYRDKTMIMISHRERNQDLFTRKICLMEGNINEDN
ncbi:MAG: peptidase domain-containing ABC transporter [Bacilli bacterium]|nr:peptidase domain-containing ABC transporter [Bacilli bacterium]